MKKRYYVLITIFLLIAFCVVWNIYDNQRFVVTEQTVTLDDLPNSFDGIIFFKFPTFTGSISEKSIRFAFCY